MSLEAVIFDFGGVILDIDYTATVRALSQVLGLESEKFYTQHRQTSLFDDIETGAISEETFYAGLTAMATQPVSQLTLEEAWNAMLGGVRAERLDFVRKVGQRYRIFLLSNTNSIHKRAFDKTLMAVTGSPDGFERLFEKAYFSHLLGKRKPHAAVFEHVLKAHGLSAERTLFIDDSEQHIRGAQSVGLQTYHLQTELLASSLPQRLL